MKKLSLEKTQALLKRFDPEMPEKFSVLGIVYSKETDTYYVKWFDEAEKETYDDGVAQAKASGAKAAYSFTPTYSYSALWFNEGPDGNESPAVQFLGMKDLSDLRKNGENFVVVDIA